jgi:poly-gamma-glutamate synthesis protein (capsule biosynthesis protein)
MQQTTMKPGAILPVRPSCRGGSSVFCSIVVLLLFSPVVAESDGLRFYGDLLLSRGIEKFVNDRGAAPVKEALAPFLARDALHVVNLEGAVGTACTPGRSPCFSIKPEMLDLLAGFDLVSLENNHALDTGSDGGQRTVDGLHQREIATLAGKRSSAFRETSAGTIAVISATDVVNGASDRQHLLAADSSQLLAEIRRLKRTASIVAVYVHWGRELIAAPTERMRNLARSYVAAGADLIVGTHPHVPGGTACLEGKPVAWSLGNFLFDQKYDTTKRGALFDCDMEGGRLACRLTGHETPHGSYLPLPVAGDPYAAENAVLSACTPPVIASWTGQFASDRRDKRLVLIPEDKRGAMSHLELYDMETGRREIRTPAMPIRTLQPVDLNSDGIREVMLIQEIYSSLDREIAKRVYLYSFDGTFHALWRGSALSRPLLDAVFDTGLKKNPQLVALHSAETFLKRKPGTEQRTVMRYRWNGFGFSGEGEREAPIGAQGVRLVNGGVQFHKRESSNQGH